MYIVLNAALSSEAGQRDDKIDNEEHLNEGHCPLLLKSSSGRVDIQTQEKTCICLITHE